jgi:hypothetical protein
MVMKTGERGNEMRPGRRLATRQISDRKNIGLRRLARMKVTSQI